MSAPLDVFFFCNDPARDPCAATVFRALEQLPAVVRADGEFDGFPLLRARRHDGSLALFVRTQDVVSNDYARYAGLLNDRFGDVQLAVVVNWHEGANAPDDVLTFHSTGDVPSGIFAPTMPGLFSAYVRALERERVSGGLGDYRTSIEATHWSGVMFGASPDQIDAYPVPIYDMEVGSSPRCWADTRACAALARVCVLGPEPVTMAQTMVYCGGTHFEDNVTAAVLSGHWHVGHVLPNHWLVSGGYDQPGGAEKLQRCIASYREFPAHMVVHKGLAFPVKQGCTAFAEVNQLGALTHKQMRATAAQPAKPATWKG